jgi:DNA-binding transcriptional ArsR family regulator
MSTRVDSYEWMRLIRRCQLTAPTKLVALTLATYANQDGTRIFPGVARLTAVTGLSERSVRGAMKTLRDVGLIERTRVGSSMGRRALTDEHALAFPVDLVKRIEMLGPDEAPAGGAGDDTKAAAPPAAVQSGTPAPGAGTPAGGAGTPAGGAEITGTSCTPPTHYQPSTNSDTNRGLTNVGTSRTREAETDKVIPLDQVGGTAARAAITADLELRAAAKSAPHCGHPDCDPIGRWRTTPRGDIRCPECNEVSILRRAGRPQLALVGAR